MDLFEGLKWLADNHPKELIFKYKEKHELVTEMRCKMHSNTLLYFDSDTQRWCSWFPDYAEHKRYSASIPLRKLPSLPDGHHWRYSGTTCIIIEANGNLVQYALDDDTEVEKCKLEILLLQALIEEYQSRPR